MSSGGRSRRRQWIRYARWLVLLAALFLGTWAFWVEPASLRANTYNLTLNQWPFACDGLRIAVLADLHVGSPHNGLDRLKDVVEATNASAPDLILLAGDYVIQGVIGGEFVAPEAAADVLRELSARAGVYAVLGNHDWWLDPERVAKALRTRGIRLLEDANINLELDECRFTLVGISDFWEGPHDVEKAFADVLPNTPTVAFTHNPDVFPQFPHPVSLGIAGHTHGGQVALPFVGRPIVPSRFGERFAAGRIVESGQTYFVSTGIGTSILPVRFGVPPEVSVVRLERAGG